MLLSTCALAPFDAAARKFVLEPTSSIIPDVPVVVSVDGIAKVAKA
jgi:hypothetical protein